jgi:hypothetical protein
MAFGVWRYPSEEGGREAISRGPLVVVLAKPLVREGRPGCHQHQQRGHADGRGEVHDAIHKEFTVAAAWCERGDGRRRPRRQANRLQV